MATRWHVAAEIAVPARGRRTWLSVDHLVEAGRTSPKRNGLRFGRNRSLPALKPFFNSHKNSRRNSCESTRTVGRKLGRQATQRVPSSEGPPPGTMQWTCG